MLMSYVKRSGSYVEAYRRGLRVKSVRVHFQGIVRCHDAISVSSYQYEKNEDAKVDFVRQSSRQMIHPFDYVWPVSLD